MAGANADLRGMTLAVRFSLAAITLMLAVPFLQPVHRYPLTSFHSEWLALAFGLAALLPLAAGREWRELAIPPVTLFLGAFAALLCVQQALGLVPYGGQTVIALLYLAWAGMLAILAATLRRQIGLDRLVTILAWCLLAAGTVSAMVAVLQYLGFGGAFGALVARAGKVVYGNLGQPNHFAAYTSLALASLVFLASSGRTKIAVAILPAALLVFVLGLSGSRSAWAYLGLLLVLALLHARGRGPDARAPVVWAGGLIAVFILAQWLVTLVSSAGPAPPEVVTSAERLFAGEPGQGFRGQLARVAWWMFSQSPVAGAGWGQFAWHDFSYRALAEGAGIWGWPHNHAHNIVLHLLAETGLIGATLVVGAAAYWLWTQRMLDFDLQRWWLLAVLGVLGTHSMLELPMWYAYFLGIAALALGAGAARDYSFTAGTRANVVIVALIAAGAIPLATTWGTYGDFQRLFARDGAAPVSTERAAILSRAHRDILLKPYAELALTFGIDVDRDRLREKLELNGRVLRFAPIEVVAFRQAQLLALAGEREAALRLFAQAARVYPAETQAAVDTVRALAERHPAEMAALLELASETLAKQRAARTIR